MVRLNRIYTRAGDAGQTRLAGGQKVGKDALRIETYGTVDELNACVGLVRAALDGSPPPSGGPDLHACLQRIQNELFNLGSDLATLPENHRPGQPVIETRHVEALERAIDGWNRTLPDLRSFVLPGGGEVAARLHLARTVCRRAERLVVRLAAGGEPVGAAVLPYLNRLSDALFVMGRHSSRLYGEAEPLWEPEKT